MSILTLIAARGRRGAIGAKGEIPWHSKEDFAHFKRETMGATLIMGRNTWDSIGRPLPGRNTVVLTRNSQWRPEGYEELVKVAHNPEEALTYAKDFEAKIMIAGGAEIYKLYLPQATHQIITEIAVEVPQADAFYPEFNVNEWKTTRAIAQDELVFRWLTRIQP